MVNYIMPPPGPQAQQSSQESPAPPTSASPAPFQPSQTDPPPVIPPQAQSVPLSSTPGSADLPPEGVFIHLIFPVCQPKTF
jgi:hypothetical protein